MPSVEEIGRYQDAVVWPADVPDRYGQDKVGDPQEISVKWNPKQSQTTDRDGNKVTIAGQLRVYDIDIPVGSAVYIGTLADYTSDVNRGAVTDLFEVASAEEARDIKGRLVGRILSLAYSKRQLPTLA